MSYKALYRTYRPQTFNDVKGQEVVVKTLQNAIINNKISHAYLFSGPRGTGKTSIARIFAKALNCANVFEGEPCDKCISCDEISQGISPDVIEIDAASNNGVDEIRDIREKVKFLPSGSKYKIYIIDEVHMLSGGAFNALLKTLEEPPKHVIFILATTEPQKLPATIISRCQRFEFKALSVAEISERLRTICELEDVAISEEALNTISESADGAMRDALSILDQAISYGNKNVQMEDINGVTGSLSFDKVFNLASAIEKKDVHATIESINELISAGKEVGKIINSLLVFYRDVLLYKSVGNSGYTKYVFTKEQFQEFCLNIPVSKIMYLVDILSDIQNKVKVSSTPNVFLEIALIKMCNVSVEELDLIKRVAELENKFSEFGNIDFKGHVSVSEDNEKVAVLESRLNQVVSELNKLELRKQLEKLETLNQKVENNISVGSNNALDEVTQKMQSLQNKVEEMELFVNKEPESCNNDEIIKRLEVLENKEQNIDAEQLKDLINRVDSTRSQNNSVDLSDIYERLSILEKSEKSDGILDEALVLKVQQLEDDVINALDELKEIKDSIVPTKNINAQPEQAESLSEISDKLMFLERRMYQMMAGELAYKKVLKKETKKNKDQIMLFGEDLLSLSDYESKKENFDFEELEKDERTTVDYIQEVEAEENKEPFVEEIIEEDEVVLEEKFEEPEVILEDKKENVIEEPEIIKQPSLFSEEQPVDEETVSCEEQSEEPETKEVKGLFETEIIIPEKKVVEKKEDIIVSQYFDAEKGQSVINKERSSLVIREKNTVEEGYTIEKDLISQENPYNKLFDKKVEEEKIVVEEAPGKDKFASYNIKYIEQILHDSRSMEAKNDKVRIEQLWKLMTRGARPEYLSIMETLQEGKIAVVGNKEFILVFPDVYLCNQVMRGKFKEIAVRILHSLLGDTYNYVALPVDVWSAKSVEYKQQYQIGIKYPTLTPLNIKGLEVISDTDEYKSDSEKAINQTLRMFGEDNVKFE